MTQNLVLLLFVICRLISTVGLTLEPAELLQLGVEGQVSLDPSDVGRASVDFGGMTRAEPLAVMRPASAGDVASLVRAAYGSARGFPVAARGHGHSINGQAQAPDGVVIEMSQYGRAAGHRARSRPVYSPSLGEYYVDVWGGELWIDVLNWTLENGGLAPKSWTDYLYLSVGGTLSNAGISGQAFRHGPQISNVYELDVVTGMGEILTCSEEQNSELFYGVLGGLGQFGIITRARIALEPAPRRVSFIVIPSTIYIPFLLFFPSLSPCLVVMTLYWLWPVTDRPNKPSKRLCSLSPPTPPSLWDHFVFSHLP